MFWYSSTDRRACRLSECKNHIWPHHWSSFLLGALLHDSSSLYLTHLHTCSFSLCLVLFHTCAFLLFLTPTVYLKAPWHAIDPWTLRHPPSVKILKAFFDRKVKIIILSYRGNRFFCFRIRHLYSCHCLHPCVCLPTKYWHSLSQLLPNLVSDWSKWAGLYML